MHIIQWHAAFVSSFVSQPAGATNTCAKFCDAPDDATRNQDPAGTAEFLDDDRVASAQQRTVCDASEHMARCAARPTWSARLSLPMMVARTVRMPKLISSANRSLRDAVPRWHEIARAPESASN